MRSRFRPPPGRVMPPADATAGVGQDRDENRNLLRCPLLVGRYLTTGADGYETDAITFVAGTSQAFAHRLGRAWRGFVATPLTAVAARLRVDPSLDEAKEITIYPETSCVCRVWVH